MAFNAPRRFAEGHVPIVIRIFRTFATGCVALPVSTAFVWVTASFTPSSPERYGFIRMLSSSGRPSRGDFKS